MKASRLCGVAGLCVVSGSGWVLEQAYPGRMEWPFAACIHFAVIGCVALLVWLCGPGRRVRPQRRLAALAVTGTCLFVAPAAALHVAAGAVSELTSVALFCSIPVMTVLCAIALGSGGGGLSLRALLAPSVVGLGGALLMFPVDAPGSLRRWLWFGLIVAVCVMVAVLSVKMHGLMQGVPLVGAVAAIGWGCAVVLALGGATMGWPALHTGVVAGEALRCAVVDLPVVWLTVWLMREVYPERLAARFLLVPVVTVVEGYGLMRGPLESRTVAAVLLMSACGAMLLLQDEPEELPGLSLQ